MNLSAKLSEMNSMKNNPLLMASMNAFDESVSLYEDRKKYCINSFVVKSQIFFSNNTVRANFGL